MKAQKVRTIVSLTALFFAALPAHSQTVRFEFSSQVTEVSGSSLPGVTVGSVITGHLEVDLARLPNDGERHPGIGNYSYAGGHPGFTLHFDTGFQSVTFDSVNAASDGGATPGFFLSDDMGSSDHIGMQARNQGSPYAAILSFEDITVPLTLLSSDHFPDALNLEAGIARARFQYFHALGGDSVVARVTSASMTVSPGESLTALLVIRINASQLPAQRKRALLRELKGFEGALARGRCEAGMRHLKTFQKKVRAQVEKTDSELAARLSAGAQAIIDSGCSD